MATEAGSYTPETIARRQALADALYKQGAGTKPLRHWMEGVAQLGDTFTAGMLEKRNREEEKEGRAKIAEMLLGMNAGQSPGASPISTPQMPVGNAPMSGGPGKIYANDEPSPLDPPSGKDRDMAIRTMYGEAGNESPVGQQAVANVIRNRAVAGNYGGDTPSGVVTAPNQFEPWNTEAGRGKMAGLDPASPKYAQLAAALDKAYTGDDPTNGAKNFFSPKAQAALGRPVPAWAQGGGQDIGNHRFIGGAPQPSGPAMAFNGQPNTATDAPMPGAGAAPPAAPQQMAQAPQMPQPQAGDQRAKIAEMLQSKNPYVQKMGQNLAQQMIQQQFAAEKPTDEIREYQLYQKQGGKNSFFDYKTGLKKAGAIQNSVQIDQKGEGEFSKEAGKLQAKRFNDLVEDAPAAKQMMSDVEMLRDLGTKIQTGKGAEVRAAIGPYAQALGIDVKGLDEIQGFEALVNRVAPNLRVKGSGAQSDFELRNFLKSLPSIGNTEGGNEIAARVLEGLSQNKLLAAEIGARALSKEITPSQAEKDILALPDPMKEWRDFKKASSAASPVSGGSAPDRSAIEAEMKRRGLLK